MNHRPRSQSGRVIGVPLTTVGTHDERTVERSAIRRKPIRKHCGSLGTRRRLGRDCSPGRGFPDECEQHSRNHSCHQRKQSGVSRHTREQRASTRIHGPSTARAGCRTARSDRRVPGRSMAGSVVGGEGPVPSAGLRTRPGVRTSCRFRDRFPTGPRGEVLGLRDRVVEALPGGRAAVRRFVTHRRAGPVSQRSRYKSCETTLLLYCWLMQSHLYCRQNLFNTLSGTLIESCFPPVER